MTWEEPEEKMIRETDLPVWHLQLRYYKRKQHLRLRDRDRIEETDHSHF
jgi:hypothetical protein